MKKPICTIAAIALFYTATMMAQSRPFDHGGPGDTGGSTTTQTTDPATLAAREVSFLNHLLTLTTAQQTQATTIFTASITAVQALQTQITTAETALLTAIKANDATGITTQSTTLGTLHGQAIAIDAKADAAFYLLLTSDQKTKLDAVKNDGFLGSGFGFRP
jgi:hypothetical protein